MSAPFNTLRHGDLEDVLALLDREPMTEQELRAVLENVIEAVVVLQRCREFQERNQK